MLFEILAEYTLNYFTLNYFTLTDCGQMVMLGQDFPKVFEFLPILLPKHVFKLLFKEKARDADDEKRRKIIEQLNTIISNEPWKFAFRKVWEHRESCFPVPYLPRDILIFYKANGLLQT